MRFIGMLIRWATVALCATLVAGCGVQQMTVAEQLVKAEWQSSLSLTEDQVIVVRKSLGDRLSGIDARRLDEAGGALKEVMSHWDRMPNASDLSSGANAVRLANATVDHCLQLAVSAKWQEAAATAAEVSSARFKADRARERHMLAARTYNDMLELYPSKWAAKVLMKDPALTFEDHGAMSGQLTSASMLDKLQIHR